MDDGLTPELRRMMVEYGEEFWGSGWVPLYGFLGGNPLAAMPSLHFATSVMAAHMLAETGPVAGAVGWAYAGTLGRRARLPGRALRRRPRGRARAGRGHPPRPRRPWRRCSSACPAPCRRWRPGRAHDGGGRASRRLRAAGQPGAAGGRRGRAPARARRSRAATSSCSAASCSPRSRRSTSCCRRSPASTTRGTGSATAGRCGSIAALLLTVGMFAGYVAMFRGVFLRAGLADRLARELPDHDGGARRVAAVRGRRRRRARADRVGAAPLGDAQADGRRQDDRVPRADLPALRDRRRSSAASACTGGCSAARTRSRSRSCRPWSA